MQTLPWSQAEIEKARGMRRDGYSSAQIARALGRTRASVISRLHRSKEPGTLTSHSQQSETKAREHRGEPSIRRFSWETTNG